MSPPFDLDRRALLARLGMLLGAATVPLAALDAAPLARKPYLDAATMALLRSVSDTIIPETSTPGAMASKTPERFEAMLVDWALGERRYELIQALLRIDTAARNGGSKNFATMTAADRKALLAAHDRAALKPVPRKTQLTGLAALMAGAAVADPGYAKLKELIVILHYASEPALTRDLAYEHAPGEWNPSVPVTATTRPTVGGVI